MVKNAKCNTCKREYPDCTKCKVFWKEKFIVEMKWLASAVKRYALYRKTISSDVEEKDLVAKKSEGKDE